MGNPAIAANQTTRRLATWSWRLEMSTALTAKRRPRHRALSAAEVWATASRAERPRTPTKSP
eukprot:3750124-Alexandrium_andersonii.AAC.1